MECFLIGMSQILLPHWDILFQGTSALIYSFSEPFVFSKLYDLEKKNSSIVLTGFWSSWLSTLYEH